MSKNACPTEYDEQSAVIRWRDMMVAAGEHRLKLLHGDASGVRVGIGAALKMKRQGAVRGWPDLMLPIVKRDSGGVLYHGLFIELKRRRGGVVSLEQVNVQTWLRAEGYCVHVCRGAEEAIAVIKEYLGI
jgi:hypothetical protein